MAKVIANIEGDLWEVWVIYLHAFNQRMNHKQIAEEFLTMIIGWQIQEAFDQFTGEPFVHHNQYTKPGKEELIKWMQWNQEHFPEKIFDIQMIIDEWDHVMTYSMLKFTPDHPGMKVVHILRFKNDKIVEMRDVWQQIEPDAINK